MPSRKAASPPPKKVASKAAARNTDSGPAKPGDPGTDEAALKMAEVGALAGAMPFMLLEDFILRDKLTHFDHERIPERVARHRHPERETDPSAV
jgi:hypothetical protein